MSDGAGRFSVEGRVVHVSGGSRGIGLALARGLVAAGATVVVTARGEEALAATDLPWVACDVADAAAVERTAAAIEERHGPVDVLLNVAGVIHRHAAETFPIDVLDRILAVNVRGAFLTAQAAGRRMVARGGGAIVNVASIHSHTSLAGVSPYGASKGAVAAMTRALAVEWAPFGVRVNAIAPGYIVTDLTRPLWERPELRGWVEARTPAGRLGDPEDLVGSAIFLASAASAFVTGHVLYVDGGFTAGSGWPLEVPGR